MATGTHNLKAHFGYPKFACAPYRILFLDYDYFLQEPLIGELVKQGHEVTTLALPKELASEEILRALLLKAVEVRPDTIMTFNAMGFDKPGRIINLLSEYGLPVAIWYLDNHQFLGPHFENTTPDWAVAFTYERSLMDALKNTGFQHVYYLPLAADQALLGARPTTNYNFLSEHSCYLGSAFSHAVKKYHTPAFEQLYSDWKPNFSAIKQRTGRLNLDEAFQEYKDQFELVDEFNNFSAYVTASETGVHRANFLAALIDDGLMVIGPDEWRKYLPAKVIRPPASYENDRALIYSHSAINISLTALQQETALNQRYFDVPFCGGFLIGEWQESLAEHFDIESETVSFRTIEELQEKVRYYSSRPEARKKIATKASLRVLGEHLMEHRVNTMLGHLKELCA